MERSYPNEPESPPQLLTDSLEKTRQHAEKQLHS